MRETYSNNSTMSIAHRFSLSQRLDLTEITNDTFNFENLSPIGDLKTDMCCRLYIFCECEAGPNCKNPLTKHNDDGNVNDFESDTPMNE